MLIKRSLFLLTCVLCLVGCGNGGGGSTSNTSTTSKEEPRVMHNYSIYNNGVNFETSCWESPEFNYDNTLDNEGCKGLFIRSDYNGNESYAFSYLGIPENPKNEKLPAVLLLHGGGGTAYHEWVNSWVKKGFVALAIDLEGHIPNKNGKITDVPTDLYHKSIYVAPHNQNLGDENDDLTKTWLHYACRTAIIANSFLHNLDIVDINRIGVCGISWGGFITSIITGYDDRFAFSVPIYCTIGCEESGTPIGGYIKSHRKFEVFDKIEPISLINTPIKMIFSDGDTHCNPLFSSDLISSAKNSSIAIIPGLLHSHYDALMLTEPINFAYDVFEKQENVKFDFANDMKLVTIMMPFNKKFGYICINYTSEDIINSSTRWKTKEISSEDISGNIITLNHKDSTTYFYVSIIDERGSTYSSFIKRIK